MDEVATDVSAASAMLRHEVETDGWICGNGEDWTPLVGIAMKNMMIGTN